MEKILLLLHTNEDGALPKAALEAVTAAKRLVEALPGSSLTLGLVGSEIQEAANAVANCGAARILGVAGEAFATARYATDAAAAEAIARAAQASLIMAPGTSRWSRVLAGVAQRLGGKVDTHVVSVAVENGAPAIRRWYYRQRMEALTSRTDRPWVIALDAGAQPAWTGDSAPASVEMLTVETPEAMSRTTVTGFQAPETGGQTIRPDAALLFVAGAGWTKKQPDGDVHASEAADLILGFLRQTKASLGSTKSLVDLSGEGQAVLPFLTHLHQVGQTGATPRHPKGLATCCHGEEPHVVGWRFINERRAVNLDANCGWARGKADVLYVADAFEVIRAIRALLNEG